MNARAIMGKEAFTKDNFEKAVKQLYGENATAILNVYKVNNDSEVEAVATALAGDRFIGFSTWRWSDMHEKTGAGKPVYRYFYARPRPTEKGAVHSAEIEYAMGNLHYNKVYAWTKDDHAVSATMQAYFANFIKTGNPNGANLPNWPATKTSKPVPVMRIDVKTVLEKDAHEARYKLLEQIAEKK